MFAMNLSSLVDSCELRKRLKMYGEQKTLDPIVSQGIEAIASESSKAHTSSIGCESTPNLQDRWIHKVQRLVSGHEKSHRRFPAVRLDAMRLQIDLPQKAEINGDLFELEILVLNLLRNAADALNAQRQGAHKSLCNF